MANRIATSSDVSNPVFIDWINLADIPIMQVGDFIIDVVPTVYIANSSQNSILTTNVIASASGNNSGDTDLVMSAAIPSETLAEGVIKIDNGAGLYDYYHYSSWIGSSYILNIANHPSGLVRTYTGSEQCYVANLRIGATIWIDSGTMDLENVEFRSCRIFNVNNETWQYMSTLTNPIEVRPLGGRAVFSGDPGGAGFHVNSFSHVLYDGESTFYPGLREPFKNSAFLTGTFGFFVGDDYLSVSHNVDTHCGIRPEGTTSVQFLGFEGYGSFSCFRIHQGGTVENEIDYDLVRVERCYPHDSERGEGIYAGNTFDFNALGPRFNKWIVRDNVFARRATESIQILSINDASRESVFENNLIIGGASDWLNPFQPFQDGCWAMVFGDGNAKVRNNISDMTTANFHIVHGAAFGNTGDVLWQRNLELNGELINYIHATTGGSAGLTHKFDQAWTINPRRNNLRKPSFSGSIYNWTYLYSQNNGTADVKYNHLRKESSMPQFFQLLNSDEAIDALDDDTLALPEYINPGIRYEDTASDSNGVDYVGRWSDVWYPNVNVASAADNGNGDVRITTNVEHEMADGASCILKDNTGYDGYYNGTVIRISATQYDLIGTPFVATGTGTSGVATSFNLDEVVTVWRTKANGGFSLWKCILAHTTSSNINQEPEFQPTRWERIWFDVNGVRSDALGYTGIPDPFTGGAFPPDNVLLPENDFWNKKGIGLSQNPNSNTWTMHKWYYADDATGTNKALIYGAKEKDFNIEDIRYSWIKRKTGKYIIGSITPIDENGLIGIETFSTGVVITDVLSDAVHYKETSTHTSDPAQGKLYRYPSWVYEPQGYVENTSTLYPLVIFLHGTGVIGTNLDLLLTGDAPTMTSEIGTDGGTLPNAGANEFWKDAQMICLSPQLASGDGDWWTNRISEYIRFAIANFRVDPTKIYITGLSLGAIYPFQYIFRSMYSYESDNFEPVRGVFLIAGSNASIGGENPRNIIQAETQVKAWVGRDDTSYYALTLSYVDAINAIEPDYATIDVISRKFDFINESGGPFILHEILSWGTGTGKLVRKIDDGVSGTMWVTLETGVEVIDALQITGETSNAICTVSGAPSIIAHSPDAWGVPYTDYSSTSFYRIPINAIKLPSLTSATITGTETVGSILTAIENGFDPGEGVIAGTHTYEWYRHTNASGTEVRIIGETSNTYTIQAADQGFSIACAIKPVNNFGDIGAAVYSSGTILIP